MIIAIDGSAAAGKGTLAQKLIKQFGYAYLDTGALYRSVGLKLYEQKLDPTDVKAAQTAALDLKADEMLHLQTNPAIRTEEIGAYASKVSAIPEVRQALFDFQRRFAFHPVNTDGTPAPGAVLDGRDIGTVVCPEAEIKLFLKASPEVRALRRLKELQAKGICAIYDTILSDIKERDERDSKRAVAPLKPASDALVLDTSEMSPDDVFAAVIDFIKGKGLM